MKIKDVVIRTLRYAGRDDVADVLDSGGQPDGEGGDAARVALYCVNAAEDELARYYMPLVRRDSLHSVSGKFLFSKFSRTPVKLLKVYSGGKERDYRKIEGGIYLDYKDIEVEYCFAPDRKELGGDSDFGDGTGENLLALGAVAEFFLISGEAELAEAWNKKYRAAVDRALNFKKKAGIPPRRWV